MFNITEVQLELGIVLPNYKRRPDIIDYILSLVPIDHVVNAHTFCITIIAKLVIRSEFGSTVWVFKFNSYEF